MTYAARDLDGITHYFKAHMALTANEIRAIWMVEGRRRNYELV